MSQFAHCSLFILQNYVFKYGCYAFVADFSHDNMCLLQAITEKTIAY